MNAKRALVTATFAAMMLKATDASAHVSNDVEVMLYAIIAFQVLLAAVIFSARRASLQRRVIFAILYWLSIFGIWVLLDRNIIAMNEISFWGAFFGAPIVLIIIFKYFLTRSPR